MDDVSVIDRFEDLRVTLEDGVATLLFNRPHTRNALGSRLMSEIGAAVAWLHECDDIRVVVLRGAGGHFCAGGDLNSMRDTPAAPAAGPDPVHGRYRAFGDVLTRLNRLPAAVIAAVEGTCVGGGFGMAACADLVLADTTARFGLPEPRHGFIPSQIIPFLIRRLGEAPVRRIAVTAGIITADEALRIGMVDRLLPAGALDDALQAEIRDIKRSAPRAIAAVKHLVLDASEQPLDTVLDRGATRLLELLRGDEARAGIAAFLSKTPPPWRR
jgi:isohexenylglutaconyl-CoA hydratase